MIDFLYLDARSGLWYGQSNHYNPHHILDNKLSIAVPHKQRRNSIKLPCRRTHASKRIKIKNPTADVFPLQNSSLILYSIFYQNFINHFLVLFSFEKIHLKLFGDRNKYSQIIATHRACSSKHKAKRLNEKENGMERNRLQDACLKKNQTIWSLIESDFFLFLHLLVLKIAVQDVWFF